MLHTDTKFTSQSGTQFSTTVGGSTLHITDRCSVPATAQVEPNIVMGPGAPGSVDKGTPEPRGERVIVTTNAPQTAATFTWSLTF